jgi:N-acetylglucosaminyldiphosphoundecaprenol N-acetyl-beta-D-mannosaminyltransferase
MNSATQSNTETILDYPITLDSTETCVERIMAWLDRGGKARVFVCANPHSLVMARSDPFFRRAMLKADLLTPDGAGIVLASKILGGSIRTRVTGSDIFAGLNRALDRKGGGRVFFLGSSAANLEVIKKKMAEVYPGLEVAGTYSPPFKAEFSPEDSRRMVAAVNACRPQVLWVGMTAPKQEKWIHLNRERLDVNFIGAVGAVFDFFIGRVKRSHPFFQSIGLEWLPRLLQEPGRLWRRNLISTPLFLAMVLRARESRGGNK